MKTNGTAPGQEPGQGQRSGQEPTETTSPGQVPNGGGQVPPADYEAELSSTRKEAAGYRRQLREVQTQLEAFQSQKQQQEEQEALKRGEHEKVIEQLRKELESERQRNQEVLLTSAIRQGLQPLKPHQEAMGDILALLDRSSLKLGKDGTVEGLQEALEAFKESKPYLFQAEAGQEAPKQPEQTPQGKGFGGYRPPAGNHQEHPVTDEHRRKAALWGDGWTPEDVRDLDVDRARAKARQQRS